MIMLKKVGNSLYDRQRPSFANLILNILLIVIILIFVAEIIFNMYFMNIYVKGKSMMPTLIGAPTAGNNSILSGGDYVFVDSHAIPDYSDIVVAKTTSAEGMSYNIIKRVIAFGGDTVKIDRGQLYLKRAGEDEFTKIQEDYVAVENNDPTVVVNTFETHVVKEGCMFLMGDNRNVSEDSRQKGDFSMESLVGVVPQWSIDNKQWITSIYTFFEFTLGFNRLNSKMYGD